MIGNGSAGDVVTELQNALVGLGFNPGPVDGAFGELTDAAVKAFQSAKGLDADGVVGDGTWGAIDTAHAEIAAAKVAADAAAAQAAQAAAATAAADAAAAAKAAEEAATAKAAEETATAKAAEEAAAAKAAEEAAASDTSVSSLISAVQDAMAASEAPPVSLEAL